ncbi:MAG: hypothetical protein JST19_18225 [Bacteroidetes bacterium]|nr:hypothetical protein [Bacteroidota bacterium]
MTWFKFLLWLAGLYVVYYLIVMLWDIARNKKGASDAGWTNELHFDGGFVPQRIGQEDAEEGENPVSALGGVTLKGLFDLAKAQSVEYTRGVSF